MTVRDIKVKGYADDEKPPARPRFINYTFICSCIFLQKDENRG